MRACGQIKYGETHQLLVCYQYLSPLVYKKPLNTYMLTIGGLSQERIGELAAKAAWTAGIKLLGLYHYPLNITTLRSAPSGGFHL